MPKITKNKNRQLEKKISLPSDESIKKIAQLLHAQCVKEEKKNKYARVREILSLLGKGAILAGAFLAPKSASLLLPLVQESPDYREWKKYNVSYLQRTLKRLKRQKQVKLTEKDGQMILSLTQNGKKKILKYSLQTLNIEKPKKWDGKWRLVLYDIPKKEKTISDIIRNTLKLWEFYQIQASVYIYPYPCANQIEFMREYYGLGDKVQYMVVEKIEHDQLFKDYFGLS